MFEFLNYGESVLTFVVFLVAVYLNKDSRKKSYFLIIVTGLMFFYTLLGMPIVQEKKASENVASFKDNASLSCTSGFLVFSALFTVHANQWDLEGNYFINKETNETIRTDKCKL